MPKISMPSQLALGLSLTGLFAAPLHAQFEYVQSGGGFRTDAINLARAADATAIGLDEYGEPHFITHINDGLYGNSQSWLALDDHDSTYNSLAESLSWVGVQWTTPVTIASFAFGRDNLGGFADRSGGPYAIQVDQGGGWVDVGTLIYGETITVASNSLRNLFNLTSPLTGVTAFRILTTRGAEYISGYDPETESDIINFTTGQAIDELEIYAAAAPIPEPSAAAALLGAAALALAASRRRAPASATNDSKTGFGDGTPSVRTTASAR
jgi:hypothetical protein